MKSVCLCACLVSVHGAGMHAWCVGVYPENLGMFCVVLWKKISILLNLFGCLDLIHQNTSGQLCLDFFSPPYKVGEIMYLCFLFPLHQVGEVLYWEWPLGLELLQGEMGMQWELFALGRPRLQWAKAQNGSIKGSSVSVTRGIMKNQRTREIIITQKTSHKHNHKDLCWLRYLSPGMRAYTCGGVYVPCIYSHARWELPQATQVFVVVFVWRLAFAH